jgi:hypothetical protein
MKYTARGLEWHIVKIATRPVSRVAEYQISPTPCGTWRSTNATFTAASSRKALKMK